MVILQFGEYRFPHNPAKLRVVIAQNVVAEQCVGGGEITGCLGRRRTIVEGEGEFYGSSALYQYQQLHHIFELGKAQTLLCPGLEPMQALPEQLELIGQGGSGTVGYRFRFVEAESVRGR